MVRAATATSVRRRTGRRNSRIHRSYSAAVAALTPPGSPSGRKVHAVCGSPGSDGEDISSACPLCAWLQGACRTRALPERAPVDRAGDARRARASGLHLRSSTQQLANRARRSTGSCVPKPEWNELELPCSPRRCPYVSCRWALGAIPQLTAATVTETARCRWAQWRWRQTFPGSCMPEPSICATGLIRRSSHMDC